MIGSWLKDVIVGGTPGRKRQPKSYQIGLDQPELLEERRVLSAVSGVEELPASAEVETLETVAKSGKHKHSQPKAAPEFPTLTGTWDLTAVTHFGNNSPVTFLGTIQFSQDNGKLSGNVQLAGLPLFTVAGKLGKQDVNSFTGKTKFPVEIGEGSFRPVKAKITLEFAQNGQSFSGSASRTFFGRTYTIDLTANKQV